MNPDLAVAHHNRGYVYYVKGEYDRAVTEYDKAIRLDPNDGDYYNHRGNAFYSKGTTTAPWPITARRSS